MLSLLWLLIKAIVVVIDMEDVDQIIIIPTIEVEETTQVTAIETAHITMKGWKGSLR